MICEFLIIVLVYKEILFWPKICCIYFKFELTSHMFFIRNVTEVKIYNLITFKKLFYK